MSSLPILRGRSSAADGTIKWSSVDGKRLETWLRYIKDDSEIEAKFRIAQKKRTLSQNAYYWGVPVRMLAEAAGYSDEEMHDALRWEFLKVRADGKLPSVRSTTELSTVEFEEYMAKIRQLAAEMYGLYIPDPGESL